MKALFLIIILLCTGFTMAQLSSYRQLLIFGNKTNEQQVQQQLSLLNKAATGVKERDLKVTAVESESPLYRKYHVKAASFTLILVGKDGYEKYRSDTIITTEHLFSIIDAMPMRRQEMKKDDKRNNH